MSTCKVCDDVGVAMFTLEDGSNGQRVCNEPDCQGAKNIQEETQAMTRLLSTIDDYKQINLTKGANRLAMARYRNRLFDEFDRYMKLLTGNQVPEEPKEKSLLIGVSKS